MSEPEDERIDYELDRFMEGRGYTCSVAAAKVNELEAENQRLKEYLKRVLDLDLDVASDEDRKVLEEIAALEGGDE